MKEIQELCLPKLLIWFWLRSISASWSHFLSSGTSVTHSLCTTSHNRISAGDCKLHSVTVNFRRVCLIVPVSKIRPTHTLFSASSWTFLKADNSKAHLLGIMSLDSIGSQEPSTSTFSNWQQKSRTWLKSYDLSKISIGGHGCFNRSLIAWSC